MDKARFKILEHNAEYLQQCDKELDTRKIQIEGGLRKGDPISPNLFKLTLKYVFKELKSKKCL